MAGLRFSPPAVPADPEIRWMLSRAFASGAFAPLPLLDRERALDLAGRFDLAARIGARQPAGILSVEVGREGAHRLLNAHRFTAARTLLLRQLRVKVLDVAEELRIPVVMMKFAALDSMGYCPVGTRSAGDLDIAVPPKAVGLLRKGLLSAGFVDSGFRGNEYHDRALFHPMGGGVDIHRKFLGVRVGRRDASATVEELIEAGLATQVSTLPGQAFVPLPEILAAHAIVHGLAQHGFSPKGYPLMRLISDLCDLGIEDLQTEPRKSRIASCLASVVEPSEIDSTMALAGLLMAGQALPDQLRDGPRVILAHMLAGPLVPNYDESLRLRDFFSPVSDRTRPIALAIRILRTLFPNRAGVNETYGFTHSSSQYAMRILGRPLDVLLKGIRYFRAGMLLDVKGRVSKGNR